MQARERIRIHQRRFSPSALEPTAFESRWPIARPLILLITGYATCFYRIPCYVPILRTGPNDSNAFEKLFHVAYVVGYVVDLPVRNVKFQFYLMLHSIQCCIRRSDNIGGKGSTHPRKNAAILRVRLTFEQHDRD